MIVASRQQAEHSWVNKMYPAASFEATRKTSRGFGLPLISTSEAPQMAAERPSLCFPIANGSDQTANQTVSSARHHYQAPGNVLRTGGYGWLRTGKHAPHVSPNAAFTR